MERKSRTPRRKATLTVYADWAPWWTALPLDLLTLLNGSMEKVIGITKFDHSPGCDIEPHPFCLLSAPGGFQLSPLKASLGEVMHPPSPALYHRPKIPSMHNSMEFSQVKGRFTLVQWGVGWTRLFGERNISSEIKRYWACHSEDTQNTSEQAKSTEESRGGGLKV